MKFTIYAEPRLSFTLSAADVAMLMQLSAVHYDGVCQSVSKPGHGSFLWAWNGSQHEARTDDAEVHGATNREVQTCMKILEVGSSIPEFRDRSWHLSDLLRRALFEAGDACLSWNREFNIR